MVDVRGLIDDAIGKDGFIRDSIVSDRYAREDENIAETPQSPITNQITIINKPEANTMTNHPQKINNFNAPMSGVIGSDNANVSNNQFTQNNNANTAELLQMIATLRQTATQFPEEIRDDIIIDIDDVEVEIQKPKGERNLPKLRKRLIALAAASSLIAAPIAGMTDFVNNVIDLATKVGIELPSQ
jgi:internalin A